MHGLRSLGAWAFGGLVIAGAACSSSSGGGGATQADSGTAEGDGSTPVDGASTDTGSADDTSAPVESAAPYDAGCPMIGPGSSYVTQAVADGGVPTTMQGGTVADGTYVLTARTVPSNGPQPEPIAGQMTISTVGTTRYYVHAEGAQNGTPVVESGTFSFDSAAGQVTISQQCPPPAGSGMALYGYTAMGKTLELEWSDESGVDEVWTLP